MRGRCPVSTGWSSAATTTVETTAGVCAPPTVCRPPRRLFTSAPPRAFTHKAAWLRCNAGGPS